MRMVTCKTTTSSHQAVCLQTTIPRLGSCLREFLVNHLIEKVDVAILGASGVTRSQRRLGRFTHLSAGDAN
jgi:hypothetical protein